MLKEHSLVAVLIIELFQIKQVFKSTLEEKNSLSVIQTCLQLNEFFNARIFENPFELHYKENQVSSYQN